MTGRPEFNFPAFHEAARLARSLGWEAANPAENFGGLTDLPRSTYLRVDVAMLAGCDAIAMLAGWEESRGSRLEYLLAREMEMPVYDGTTMTLLRNPPPARVSLDDDQNGVGVLDAAKRLTEGDRHRDYGHPADDFSRVALMWTGILKNKLREDAVVSAGDVPLCMIAVKIARQSHRHKRDNLVDIAGYAQTAAMLADGR